MKKLDLNKKLFAAHKSGVEEQTAIIIKMIKKDIAYQETRLDNDFQRDKPIKWRISGMKYLLSILESPCELCGISFEEQSEIEDMQVCERCLEKGKKEGRFVDNPDCA